MSAPSSTPTDADLARQVMSASPGQAAAAESELCRRFASRIRLYGLRHLRDASAADDLVQQCLELTLTKLRNGQVREPERIASFVLGVARMQARSLRRGAQREHLGGEVADESTVVTSVEPRSLELDRLASCLEKLGGRERSVILLTFFDDQSAPEVGAALGISTGNVRVIRHRAMDRLRRCMGPEELT